MWCLTGYTLDFNNPKRSHHGPHLTRCFLPLGVMSIPTPDSRRLPKNIEVNVYPFGGLLETLAFAKSLRPEKNSVQTIRRDIHQRHPGRSFFGTGRQGLEVDGTGFFPTWKIWVIFLKFHVKIFSFFWCKNACGLNSWIFSLDYPPGN